MILAPPPEPCYDFVPVPVSAAMQSKRKLPSLIARAPKPATPKGKPRLMRIVVPCPNIPEPIEPTTFELLPVLPPPETFAAPEPAVPVVVATVPEPSECECFAPIGSYVWGWGGGPGGGGGGGFSPPRTVTVTPIPDVPVWALMLAGLGILRRKT